MKYGLIWRDGRELKSPQHQKEWLEDEGVDPERITDKPIPAREGDEIVACFVAAFGQKHCNDKRGLKYRLLDECEKYFGAGVTIYICEWDREYKGVQGCIALMRDCLAFHNKQQTAPARRARRNTPKQQYPDFYLALDAAGKRRFDREFTFGVHETVELMARAYSTSRASINRVAKAKNLTRPQRR